MSGQSRLHTDDVNQLADQIADRLVRRLQSLPVGSVPAKTLLSADGVAELLGVTPGWVRHHAEDLGAMRLGDGPRPRLRFDHARVIAEMNRRSESEGSDVVTSASDTAGLTPPRRPGSGIALDLMPVRTVKPRPLPINSPGDADTSRGPALGG